MGKMKLGLTRWLFFFLLFFFISSRVFQWLLSVAASDYRVRNRSCVWKASVLPKRICFLKVSGRAAELNSCTLQACQWSSSENGSWLKTCRHSPPLRPGFPSFFTCTDADRQTASTVAHDEYKCVENMLMKKTCISEDLSIQQQALHAIWKNSSFVLQSYTWHCQ